MNSRQLRVESSRPVGRGGRRSRELKATESHRGQATGPQASSPLGCSPLTHSDQEDPAPWIDRELGLAHEPAEGEIHPFRAPSRQAPCLAGHSLADWIEDLRPGLLSFTRRRMMRSIESHYEPEDVLQDSLHNAWRTLEADGPLKTPASFSNPDGFSRWMKRVIRNRVLDLCRRVNVRAEIWPASLPGASDELGEWALSPNPSASFSALGPGGSMGKQGAADEVVDELGGIPFEERICVLMRDIMDLEWPAVAATLERSVYGAKSLRHRAHDRID